ncbi:hypothetical protein BO79DRAFT_233864 [Aspergillus costaricaensis CBS 115574]|uniref:Uncharacterized protein n=1 Tax=Aspergillus costaricaensis CBS 115574 TaxID=1448317 RepID=A0ACD1HXR0_9EURO|nr:hypothetical protein BO79DRAFT_233864 [Aspergillus costaricaensis CBS 115574]RAK82832.1 hypothetical protein BO79DRAFT_233864 [Aspergillus costaricaensis CBS 115574]
MAGKENTRGISSLPQELYDEVTLFFANYGLEAEDRIARLMCLRLVSVSFNRSATRVLLSAVRLSVSRLLETPQLLRVQSPSSIKSIFTSDLCRFIRSLTVFSSDWFAKAVKRPHNNLFRCLKRLPLLQYFEINYRSQYPHAVVYMLLALECAHRYLPRLRELKIDLPAYSSLKYLAPCLRRLEGVLRTYLPQLQHIDITFVSDFYEIMDDFVDQDFLHLFRLGRGLRSIRLVGISTCANYPEIYNRESWLHPDAPIEHIELDEFTAPFEVLARIFNYERTLVSLDIIRVSLSTGEWRDFFLKIRKLPLLSHLHIYRLNYADDGIYLPQGLTKKDEDAAQSAREMTKKRSEALPRGQVRMIFPSQAARLSKHGLHLH